MRRELRISRQVDKQLEAISQPFREQIRQALIKYRDTGQGRVKKLKNRPEYSLRIGEYRALFLREFGKSELDPCEFVNVMAIEHRSSVYD